MDDTPALGGICEGHVCDIDEAVVLPMSEVSKGTDAQTVSTKLPGDLVGALPTDRTENEHPLRRVQSVRTGTHETLEQYRQMRHMGTGAFGVVLEVASPEGRSFALKTIELKTLKDAQRFASELVIAKRMNHPNIVRVYDYYKTSEAYSLVMDLLDGGDLLDAIKASMKLDFFSQPLQKGLPGPAIGPYLSQMLSGVAYLHHHRVAHRDIKPENYMLASSPKSLSGYNWPEIKLIDFGFAHEFEKGQRMRTQVGTVRYVAPEVMGNTEGYTEACDVYGIGATAYVMCSGTFAFATVADNEELLRVIKERDPSFTGDDWKRHPKALKRLVASMMQRNPIDRPTPRMLIRMDEWLVKSGSANGARGVAKGGACCAIS